MVKIKSAKFVDYEEKSKQEQEQAVIDAAKEQEEGKTLAAEGGEKLDIDDNVILNYIKEKHGKEVDSIDKLFEEKVVVKEPELPETVKKYMDFEKETGRGFSDFMNYQRDLTSLSEDARLKEYYKDMNDNFDEKDVDHLLKMKFSYDEEMDEENEVIKKKLEKKAEIGKATKYLREKQEKYKVPVESTATSLEQTDGYKQYQEALKNAKLQQEESQRRAELFQQNTNKFFSEEFKGFDFAVREDKQLNFKPASADELKKNQASLLNFIKKFGNDKGEITDLAGYHKALAIGSNPEKFAKFFYEQGVSDASDGLVKSLKNTNMGERATPARQKNGPSVRVLRDSSDGNSLKINKNLFKS